MNEHGVVISEAEISINLNELHSYAEFLSECMKEYSDILSRCTTDGIRDVRICNRIKGLSDVLASYVGRLEDICSGIEEKVSLAESDITEIDHFDFPMEIFNSVESIIHTLVG